MLSGMNIIGAAGAIVLMPNVMGFVLSAAFLAGFVVGLFRSRR